MNRNRDAMNNNKNGCFSVLVLKKLNNVGVGYYVINYIPIRDVMFPAAEMR